MALEEELFGDEQKWKERFEKLFFVGKDYCEKTEAHKKEQCEAKKLARGLLDLYGASRENFEKEAALVLVEKDASRLSESIQDFEEKHGVKISEVKEKKGNKYPKFQEYYNSIYSVCTDILHTDRKDEMGLRNDDWTKIKFVHELPVWDPSQDILKYLIGQDKMKKVMTMIAKTGKKRNIEMYGPPGTGKSLAAKGLAQELMKIDPVRDINFDPDLAAALSFHTLPKLDGSIIKGGTVHLFYQEVLMNRILNELPREVCDMVAWYNDLAPSRPYANVLPPSWGQKYRDYLDAVLGYKSDTQENLIDTGGLAILGLIFYSISTKLVGGIGMDGAFQGAFPYFFAMTPYMFMKMRSWFGFMGGEKRDVKLRKQLPKVLVSHPTATVPFVDATGSGAMELLGTVKHISLGNQSSPEHEWLDAGKIFEANGGILYIDEKESVFDAKSPDYRLIVASLKSMMEDRSYYVKYHGGSSGGGTHEVSTFNKLPTRFILAVAGNEPIEDKALQNRIMARGYPIYVETDMYDTPENRRAVVRFAEQWAKIEKKDANETLLPMTIEASTVLIDLSREFSTKAKSLTTSFRTLGAYIMAASDHAASEYSDKILHEHMVWARENHVPIEKQQLLRQLIEKKSKRSLFTEGTKTGRVNGLAAYVFNGLVMEGDVGPKEVMLSPRAGDMMRIVYPSISGALAQRGIDNSLSIFAKIIDNDIRKYDINFEAIEAYSGVDGNSATAAEVMALLSDYADIPVKQEFGYTGALSTRGEVLTVGGIAWKLRGGLREGLTKFMIPYKNKDDVPTDVEEKLGENLMYAKTLKDYIMTLDIDMGDEKHRKIVEAVDGLLRRGGEYQEN